MVAPILLLCDPDTTDDIDRADVVDEELLALFDAVEETGEHLLELICEAHAPNARLEAIDPV